MAKSEPIPRKVLDDLKEQLDRMPRDNDRIRLIRQVAINYTLTCAEVKELAEAQRYGQSAVDTVVLSFPKLSDPQGIGLVIESFKYPEDKAQIRSQLAAKFKVII